MANLRRIAKVPKSNNLISLHNRFCFIIIRGGILLNYTHTKSWLILLKRLWSPNRKYKDRLFQRVFRDKEYLLELYNAINGTTYSNVDDLEITTLEDVIFMSMKNDTSSQFGNIPN